MITGDIKLGSKFLYFSSNGKVQTGSVLLGLSENSESVLAFKSKRATHIVLKISLHLSINMQ